MNKIVFLLLLLFALPFISATILDADDAIEDLREDVIGIGAGGTDIEATGINCFDYYVFGSLDFAFPRAEKISYSPGETASAITTMVNNNPYPLIHGNVIAQVYFENKETGNTQGDFLLDEFIAFDGLALVPWQGYDLSVEWDVPENAPEGNYYFAFYFQEKRVFNLSGLPFAPHVYGGIAEFKVESPNEKQPFYLDRNAVYLNNEEQLLRHHIKNFEPGSEISYDFPLYNESEETLDISVKHELYFWDQSTTQNLLHEYTESSLVSVNPGSFENISVSLSGLDTGVYLLKTTAYTDDWQNILFLRFSMEGGIGRFISAGLTEFPVVRGDSFEMFACFSNSADFFNEFEGTAVIELKDSDGNLIESHSFSGTISPKIIAIAQELEAQESFEELYLTARISDDLGNIHQEITKVYMLRDFRDPGYVERFEERRDEVGDAPTPSPTPDPTPTPTRTPPTPTPTPVTPEPADDPINFELYAFLAIVVTAVIAVLFLFFQKSKKEGGD